PVAGPPEDSGVEPNEKSTAPPAFHFVGNATASRPGAETAAAIETIATIARSPLPVPGIVLSSLPCLARGRSEGERFCPRAAKDPIDKEVPGRLTRSRRSTRARRGSRGRGPARRTAATARSARGSARPCEPPTPAARARRSRPRDGPGPTCRPRRTG